MILIKLFTTFFKIGAFAFGGGYAMLSLIQSELQINGWLTAAEFADIIAIAEMTPGVIAINSATFVGNKVAGVAGGAIATMGVFMPSLILVLLVSHAFFKFKDHRLVKGAFYGIRPVVAALIMNAAVAIAKTSIMNTEIIKSVSDFLAEPLNFVDIKAVVIFIASLITIIKFKLHPIVLVLSAAAVGLGMYYLGWI